MAFRRGGTPLTGALPSLEASNQAQIDDLVQRNRTLEHTNKKLAQEVAQERTRGNDAVLEIQRKWASNDLLWKEGCDNILRSYRIVQKQLEMEVETERGNVIKELAITREEKLQRLKRDYKIKQFQMREQELELVIEDLEGEKTTLAQTMEAELEEAMEKTARYAAKLKEEKESFRVKLETVRTGLRDATKAREDKEAELNELRKEHSVLESDFTSMDSKLQRTLLQLEHAQTKITELERLNNDLTRTNAKLTNQIERWQNLETKEGEAAEQQQKRIRRLELQLQELQDAHEQEREQAAKELAKEKKRIDNLKASLTNWEVEAKDKKRENAELEKKVAKLEKTCSKLKEDLEVERARVRPPSPQKPRVSSPPPNEDDEDDAIEEDNREKIIPPKKPPSIKKPMPSKSSSSTTAENSKGPSRQIARKSTGGKPPRPYKPSPPEVFEISDQDDVEEPPPKSRRKGKAKARESEEEPEPEPERKKGKRKAVEDEEPEPEPERKQKGKRKAVEDEDEDDAEIVPRPSKKAYKTKDDAKETTDGSKTKVKRGGSKQPTARPGLDDRDEEDEVPDAVKKKKRKILPPFAGGPFAFGNLKLAQVEDTMNIPSVLSPLKMDEHVPQRSTSSNLSKLRRQF